MYLSKLVINGFKSFANRTKFEFSAGLTGIIGPNGCGKSNIVDAIRWVLGEQKVSSLRSDKMENVIFNGTNARKPLGMAEVSLTIENNKNILPSEYTEVNITRRLFRSGESQYLLNGQPVRLKDIQNLFIDTGMSTDAYSIIELKMVEQILSDNKEERRRLFEEAAGIKKYKMHRRAALRKLDQTRQELTRLNDIIAEVQRNVNSLSRQVGKTRRYQALKEELKEKEIESRVYKYQQYMDANIPLNDELFAINDSKEKFAAGIAAKESEMEQVKKVVLDIEKEFQDIQRELAKEQSRIQELEKDNIVAKQQLEMLNREKERANTELTETGNKLEEISAFLKQNTPLADELEIEKEALETKFSEVAEEKTELSAKAEQLRETLGEKEHLAKELFKKISALQEDINKNEYQISSRSEEKERLLSEIRIIEETRTDKNNRIDGLVKKSDEYKTALSSLEKETVKAERKKQELRRKADKLKNELNSVEKRLSAMEKEIKIYQHLMETYEGYSSAIQYVMQKYSGNNGVVDTLPNLFSVESEAEEEVTHFLSELSEMVVVNDMDTVSLLLDEVKRNKQGSIGLVPRAELNGKPDRLVGLEGAEPLLDFIRPMSGYEELIGSLFATVYKTSDMKTAVELHKKYPAFTFIAPDGYVTGPFVQVKGGARNANRAGLVGRKNQIKKLQKEFDKLTSDGVKLVKELDETEKALSEVAALMEEKQYQLAEVKREYDIVAGELQKNEIERHNIDERLQDMRSRVENHEKQLVVWSEQLKELKPLMERRNMELDALEDELEDLRKESGYLENDLHKVTDEYNRLNLESVQINNKISVLRNELERNGELKKSLEERIVMLEREGVKLNDEKSVKLKEEIEARTATLHELTARFAEKEKEKNKKEEIYQENKNLLLNIEEEIFQNRRNWNQAQERIRNLEFKIQENKLKANSVQEQLREYYAYEITEPVNMDNYNPEKIRYEIENINNKLLKIGEVNLLAIEEHEKEKERLTFLKEQLEDILNAEKQLLETIDELNKTAIEKFSETYEAIRENFKNVFKEFFTNGEADLELIDRDDPLESDINIKVTPKGRKLQTLTLMSAGEKTLTAISLLFSIYLVKPSPFCILDEVDAPLDDVNIGRYTQALKTFSENTQFIVVTHNKKTMEQMDSIYGITMEEEGISKVVSVKFD